MCYFRRTLSNWNMEFEKWCPSIISISYKVNTKNLSEGWLIKLKHTKQSDPMLFPKNYLEFYGQICSLFVLNITISQPLNRF